MTLLREIWGGFAAIAPLDLANLVLGVIGVGLMIRRNLWAFPIGLVAVTVQGVLFWQARFYADSLLQVFFFVLLAYGWWHWTHAAPEGKPELPVTVQPWRWRLISFGAAGLACVGWGWLEGRVTDSPMPYRDAFIAAFSVLGQLLQSRKKLENWLVWAVVNAVAVWSYWAAGITFTAFLYAIYFVLAILGWIGWSRAKRAAQGRP